MTIQQEFKSWSETEGKKLSKWRYLDHDHRWFVFMNKRIVNGPKVANITEPKPNMVWSRSK